MLVKQGLMAFFLSFVITQLSADAMNHENPMDVATAFWQALAQQDYKLANQYVVAKDQENFLKEMRSVLKELKPLPEKPDVTIHIEEGQLVGSSVLSNWVPNAHVGMVYQDGRWWIKK